MVLDHGSATDWPGHPRQAHTSLWAWVFSLVKPLDYSVPKMGLLPSSMCGPYQFYRALAFQQVGWFTHTGHGSLLGDLLPTVTQRWFFSFSEISGPHFTQDGACEAPFLKNSFCSVKNGGIFLLSPAKLEQWHRFDNIHTCLVSCTMFFHSVACGQAQK